MNNVSFCKNTILFAIFLGKRLTLLDLIKVCFKSERIFFFKYALHIERNFSKICYEIQLFKS